MIRVEMNPQEEAIAHLLAVMRNATCRSNGVKDQQYGDQNPIEIDTDGLLAEMAFGKAYNCYPDFSIFPRKGGVDLTAPSGKTVDVKATRVKNGRLLIALNKNPDEVDRYVLAIVEQGCVNLVGYMESRDAINPENIGNLGHGKGYVIPQSKLTEMPPTK